MATDKRERQRAARAEKLALEAKAASKARTIRIVKRVAIWAVLIAATLVIVSFLTGGDDADEPTSAPAPVVTLMS